MQVEFSDWEAGALACIIFFIAVMVLITTTIHHFLNTSVKLAKYMLEQSAEVPISLESIKPSSAKSLFIVLSPLFFYCHINDLSFALWNNEVHWPITLNYRC